MTGLLLGTAVGDALGLPYEGLTPMRAARLYRGPLRQRLVFGRGMVSDDTEHACLTAQALLETRGEPRLFARVLARKLRWWLVGLPGGIGWGTLRSLVRSWLGWSPETSGVRSAGNGAAMRAPVIGAWCETLDEIAPLVAASTAITHRDPRAHAGALAIAIAGHHAVHAPRIAPAHVLEDIRARIDDDELCSRLSLITCDEPPAVLAARLQLDRGVTGFVHHTVPMCLHAWLHAPDDYARAVGSVIALGGDTDTTGSIVGALAGASAGVASIPPAWLALAEWPRSRRWLARLGQRLTSRGAPLPFAWPIVPVRNAAFAIVVIAHAMRRALPPY
ncbi:MAG: ADP-ribosylglycohydrolase family protein [Kofleriaceae bacterium]|nr:ADP-ribosylglycohydrolase family protein [Kofleriaceae bacterium]